jgi:phospholipase/carboxylesterase
LNNAPATIELNPIGNDPSAAVIWLHGLGADGNDFVPVVERFDATLLLKTRFIFPHAPMRPITVNGGIEMRGWYDIAKRDIDVEEDAVGITASAVQIRALIEQEEARGIKSEQIILAGFSQGGAIALHTGLRLEKNLAGIIVLSAYLPLAATVVLERNLANQHTPILMAHGLFDPVVPLMLGQAAHHSLENLGYSIDWRTYAMAHSVTSEEIADIHRFLQRIIK